MKVLEYLQACLNQKLSDNKVFFIDSKQKYQVSILAVPITPAETKI